MFKTIPYLLIFAFLGLGVAGVVLPEYRGYLFASGTLCLIAGFIIWRLRPAATP